MRHILLPATLIAAARLLFSPLTTNALTTETAADATAALETLKDEDLPLYDSKTNADDDSSPQLRSFRAKVAYPSVNDYLSAQKFTPNAIQNKRFLLQ